MIWPDPLTPWAGRRAPGLPLGDYLRRGETGFCADCIENPGAPCPDHAPEDSS